MRSIFYSLPLLIAAAPVVVFGQQIYSPLINLQNPGNTAGGFSEYIGFLYGMSISIAALLAVVKIIIAGAKYMMSDVVSSKGDAISDIQGAILGLLLILGAVIILEFINPQLIKREIKFDALRATPTVNLSNASITVNGATMSEELEKLAVGVNSCATITPGAKSSSGTTLIYGINASGCSQEFVLAALSAFERNCISRKGTVASGGVSSKILGCAIPITIGRVLTGQKPSDYISQGLDPNFVTTTNAVATLNVIGQCTAKVTALGSNATASMKESTYKTCLTAAPNAFKNYCEDNYGRLKPSTPSTPNSPSCGLPRAIRTMSEFTAEFEAYKAANPTQQFTQTPTLEIEKLLCKNWNGTFFRNVLSANACVRY